MDIKNCHEQNIYAGYGKQGATREENMALAQEKFDVFSSQDTRIKKSFSLDGPTPTTKKWMNWWAARKLFNKDILHVYQTTGSCTGCSEGNLLNYLQCNEILKGDMEEFKYIFPFYHYAGARFLDGNRSQGDGAWGGSIAKSILEYGSISDDVSGLPKRNISQSGFSYYQPQNIEYSWSGPSGGKWLFKDYTTQGVQHKVKTVAKLSGWDDAAEALLNGYGVQVCSDIGYREVSSDGFSYPGPTWNHALYLAGADLAYKEPYGVIINSWDNYNKRINDFDTNDQLPIGSIRIKAKYIDAMIKQGDSYAYSFYDGFPSFDLNELLFNPFGDATPFNPFA